jgi:hypothetical protein
MTLRRAAVAVAVAVAAALTTVVRVALDGDVGRHYTTWCWVACMCTPALTYAAAHRFARTPALAWLHHAYAVPATFALACQLGGSSTYLFLDGGSELLAASRAKYPEGVVQVGNLALHWLPWAWTGWFFADARTASDQCWSHLARTRLVRITTHALWLLLLVFSFAAAYLYVFDVADVYGLSDESTFDLVSRSLLAHLLATALTEGGLWWLYYWPTWRAPLGSPVK